MARDWYVLGVLLLMTAALPVVADEVAHPCGTDAYGRAVCLYSMGEIDEAGQVFQLIASSEEPSPKTLRAWYFLARIRMKQGKWEEASRNLVVIYRMSRNFYWEWGCDHLLGQCREALGKN